ncbi:MAG: Hsp20/alpha crystallin family protein [Desulfobacterales bacterium]
MFIQRPFYFPDMTLRGAFSELDRLRQDMDRFMEGSGGRYFKLPTAGVFPLINLTDDKDGYFVRAELPGLKADELNISATGNTISISGERKIVSEGEDVRYYRREREAGSFNRIISLPGDVDSDKVEATLKDGILTVRIPKAEKAKPKQITVK